MKGNYSTIHLDEGIDYRRIAAIMTANGHKMNHSSVRNHILRAMRKFVVAITSRNGIDLIDENDLDRVASSPSFHRGIADTMRLIESRNNDLKEVERVKR